MPDMHVEFVIMGLVAGAPAAKRRIKTPYSSYLEMLLADLPVAYWPLDEQSGTTAFDHSGNDYHGTYTEDFVLNQPGASPAARSARMVDGYIDFGNGDEWDITAALTLEAWVRWDGTGGNDPRLLSRNANSYRLRWPGESSAGIELQGAPNALTPIVFSQEIFTHIVGTFDGAESRVYINGVLANSNSGSGPINNNDQTLYFGWEDAGISSADRWFGWASRLAIYDHALSPGRVALHSRIGRQR